jgi:hypothetical protein
MYYSGRITTYKFDRTTVTVGALRMLAISTSPALVGASSCASVAAASSATAAAGAVPSSATGGWRDICAKSSSTVGAGLRLAPADGSPTVSQSPSSPCSTGSEGDISCKQGNFVVNIQHRDVSTRLPYSRRLTSWDVVSVTFNFLATRLRATLRSLLGGAGKLASRLVGGS